MTPNLSVPDSKSEELSLLDSLYEKDDAISLKHFLPDIIHGIFLNRLDPKLGVSYLSAYLGFLETFKAGNYVKSIALNKFSEVLTEFTKVLYSNNCDQDEVSSSLIKIMTILQQISLNDEQTVLDISKNEVLLGGLVSMLKSSNSDVISHALKSLIYFAKNHEIRKKVSHLNSEEICLLILSNYDFPLKK
ncbi:hypothetical protein HELRODRAFT_168755 [Helobdella robusta]|uniref:Armadillo repeat-containing domain-containing protein n=1 Tax=Helobdella robusta TaxID=6412 RepID=T1F0X6_HELRO|nr:hypothetical protein HELRODRAFT_168755 [Helobdella robusta]ESO08843.1 hypothetical protein HELRODRAFT_168755 [Helobdella robusta]